MPAGRSAPLRRPRHVPRGRPAPPRARRGASPANARTSSMATWRRAGRGPLARRWPRARDAKEGGPGTHQ
eukprot:2354199-Pyramimonas_sp.AAC.1